MKEDGPERRDESLSALLRAGRPAAEFPPGFENAVWRRIENGNGSSAGLLERLAQLFLTPRVAAAGLAAVVIVAAGTGTMQGIRTGEREARDRYVASVDPSYPPR